MKDQYFTEDYFKLIIERCSRGEVIDGFYVVDGFLYKVGKLCIPTGSVRELLVREAHVGGLSRHFG